MLSPEDLMERTAEDPPWINSTAERSGMVAVEAILIQGQWPGVNNNLWRMESLHTAVKVVLARQNKSGKPVAGEMPEGWTGYTSYTLLHDKVGGVTNGKFPVEVQTRTQPTSPVRTLPPSVSGKLGEALSEMEGGYEVLRGPKGERNTASGILDWRHMKKGGKVKAPFVYCKSGVVVERTLTMQEQARVLDFPVSRTGRMTDRQLKILTDIEITGKITTASIFFLTTWNKERVAKDEEKRTHAEVRIKSVIDDSTLSTTFDGIQQKNTSEVVKEVDGIASAHQAKEEFDIPKVTESSHYKPNDMFMEHAKEKRGTRADEAAVPFYLWNDRVIFKLHEHWTSSTGTTPTFDVHDPLDRLKVTRALRLLRKAALRHWKGRVDRSFRKWYTATGITQKEHVDIKLAGEAAAIKAGQASWWEWDKGSTIFFWRWPPDYQDVVRKGVAPMFDSEPPTNSDRQPPYEDESIRLKVKKKLEKVIIREYITMSDIKFVEAYMYMFDVPKGTLDIWMVYDGSKSGLNKALWAPWFSLPTIDTMSRWVLAGSWLADNDYGDFFLNFPLHADLQKYC